MIATNIPLFQGINQLPIILDPIMLDEGGGIEETLRRNNDKYHQNCKLNGVTPDILIVGIYTISIDYYKYFQ
jgi:uncharacterized phosphosugar-binding protein